MTLGPETVLEMKQLHQFTAYEFPLVHCYLKMVTMEVVFSLEMI